MENTKGNVVNENKKDIETTKKITLKTNNSQKIIEELGKTNVNFLRKQVE